MVTCTPSCPRTRERSLSRRAAPLPRPHIVPMSCRKVGCSSRPLGCPSSALPGFALGRNPPARITPTGDIYGAARVPQCASLSPTVTASLVAIRGRIRGVPLSSVVLGLVCGTCVGLLSVAMMIPLKLEDKSRAMAGAFFNRFSIGPVIPIARWPVQPWMSGLVLGTLMSLTDAIVTKAWVPTMLLGAFGGTAIGLVTGRLLPWGSSRRNWPHGLPNSSLMMTRLEAENVIVPGRSRCPGIEEQCPNRREVPLPGQV